MNPVFDLARGWSWQHGKPRAQARVWVSGKHKYHHKVLELHSVELECAQLPSSTQSTVCTSVSAGGSEKNQTTWVSDSALLCTSCAALGKCFLTLGLAFHLLKMEASTGICLEGSERLSLAHPGTLCVLPLHPLRHLPSEF